MISVSTDKSNGPNWLDRLRSSRGFPTGEDKLGLDQFLTTHRTSDASAAASNHSNSSKSKAADSTRSPSTQSRPAPLIPEVQATTMSSSGMRDDQNANNHLLGNTCANILCDLFNFKNATESYRLCVKKSSRKQRNPKFCVLSTSRMRINDCSSDDLGREKSEQNGLAASGDNSLNEKQKGNGKELKEKRRKKRNVGSVGCGKVNDGEDLDWDLKLFSRSDVTVIDTSIAGWKSEKIVFRKDDVWKVKEKKSRPSSFAGSKRKMGGLCVKNKEGKKMKSIGSDEAVQEMIERKEGVLAVSNEIRADGGKVLECSKEVMGAVTQVHGEGHSDSAPGQIMQNAGSLVLVKPVHMIENSGVKLKRAGKTSLKKAPKRFIALQGPLTSSNQGKFT